MATPMLGRHALSEGRSALLRGCGKPSLERLQAVCMTALQVERDDMLISLREVESSMREHAEHVGNHTLRCRMPTSLSLPLALWKITHVGTALDASAGCRERCCSLQCVCVLAQRERHEEMLAHDSPRHTTHSCL
eukprot:1159300-Pelagomonas_calceolata.AAC.3